LSLLDAIHEYEIPRPSGSYESLVEFDNRRLTKERLLSLVITTCLDQALAVGALRGARPTDEDPHTSERATAAFKEAEESGPAAGRSPAWEPLVLRLERALMKKDPGLARSWLPEFIRLFKQEPPLYTPLTHGGHPRLILRASIAQTILRGLV